MSAALLPRRLAAAAVERAIGRALAGAGARALPCAVSLARAVSLALALALALAAMAVCPRAALAQGGGRDAWREAEGQPIREVRFLGTKVHSETYLREQIRTKVGDRFSRAAVNADLRRLYEAGYVSGNVIAYPELLPGGGVRLVFEVEELLPVVEVVYQGLESYSEKDLVETPPGVRIRPPVEEDGFRRSVPYQEYRADLDERFIVELLRRKGKFFAEVEHEAIPVPGGVRVVFHVREGPTVRVRDIVFEGNEHVPDDDLRKRIKTQTTVLYFIRAGYFDRQDLEEDMERLATYYRMLGYLDARAFVQDLRFNEERDRVTVVIRIVEGQRYKVRDIRVEGATLFSPEAIERELESREGDWFSGRAAEKDRESIRRMYMDRGYILTRVFFRHALAGGEERAIDLLFTIEEGVKITIEKIRFEGNVKTRDDVLRRDLTIFPGEVFSARALDDSKERLGRSGYYRDLQVSFDPGTAPDRRDLAIRVEEAETGNLLFGGGLSSSVGFFGRIVFVQRNFDIADVPTSLEDIAQGRFFTGGGQRLVLQLEPGAQRSRYRLSFVEPYFFPDTIPVPLQFRLNLSYYDSVIARTYEEERFEGQIGLGYRLTRDSLAEAAYRATRTTIFDISPDAPPDVIEVAGPHLVSAASLSYRIDKNLVDQFFLYYGGWGADAELEVAGGPFGGDFDFVRLEGNANVQETLFRWPGDSKHVIAARINAGVMKEYGGSRFVPIFERFYAGGPHSVRGFEARSVGPQADDEPVGGLVRVAGTLEYGFPILPGFDETYAPQWRGDLLRGVVFLDAGNVEEDIDDFTLDDFRVGVGFGLRIKIPIFPAPVALDFAFPLRKKDFDDPEIFSFSIGILPP